MERAASRKNVTVVSDDREVAAQARLAPQGEEEWLTRDVLEQNLQGEGRADVEPASPAVRRGRYAMRGGVQNERPTEKWSRKLCTSCPYATSSRNGPIGVRSRAPTP